MVAFAPKPSLLLVATSFEEDNHRKFNLKVAAAFKGEGTLTDTRLFPPLEAGMPAFGGVGAANAGGVWLGDAEIPTGLFVNGPSDTTTSGLVMRPEAVGIVT